MDSKNAFAPFIRQWDGYDHIHFINWAYRYYHRIKTGNSSYSIALRPWVQHGYVPRERLAQTAARLFKVGRLHHVLDVNFETFWRRIDPEGWVTPRDAYSHKVHKRPSAYKDFYPRDGAHFRQKVPLRVVEKKVVSEKEQSRRDWREKKGVNRDKANHGWRYGTGRKTWAKQYSNKCFRRYESQMLHHERYEDLFMGKRKDYFDPWDWD